MTQGESVNLPGLAELPDEGGEAPAAASVTLPAAGRLGGGFWLIVLLFVASGLSSLVYQVVWTRLLVLVFGSTTFATATVLAVFMGGLALGSYLAGRVSDRIQRPFLWYGILEGVIGAWALAVPLLFDAAIPLYKVVWQQFHLSVLPFSLLRFLLASFILIVPTTCMGATLPLLSKFVTTSLDVVGRRVGTLYASNTLGAVGGAMLAGFLMLPSIGLQATTVISAAVNFLLCGIVLLVAPRLEQARGQLAAPAAAAAARLALPPSTRFAVFAFAVSGAVAMIYEVGWTRTLLMVIGSSTYAFTVMLSTFLAGIFLGSLACARFVDRARQPLAWFAVLQFLICLFGLVSMATFNAVPWLNLQISAALPRDPAMAMAVRFLISSMILMPLTFCLGAIFPVVVKAATRDLEVVGRSVGTLYSANTVGAIVGAFLAGFVLVPVIGVEKTLVLASLVNMLVGIGLLFCVPAVRFSLKLVAACAFVPLALWSVTNPSNIWDHLILLSAQSERRQLVGQGLAHGSLAEWTGWLRNSADVLFWEDGASSTVGLIQYKKSRQRSLITNGHVDASDGADMKTQVLLSAYPLLWKPDSTDVGVIGWGSGVSVGTATLFPVRSVTAIELEPAVITASRFFHHVNHKPETNRLVHLEINDGRNYLLATDKLFDVIVSEPSNPWQAGVCNLFTREYFRICRQRLKPGGIFSFWLQTVEIPPQNLKEILAALHEVFPHNLAISADGGNLVVLASDRPLAVQFERLKQLLARPELAEELRKAGIDSPEAVVARVVAAPDGLSRLTKGVPPNIDDTNRLEYAVGKSYETAFFTAENAQMLEQHRGSLASQVTLGKDTPEQRAKLLAGVGKEALLIGRFASGLNWARLSLDAAANAEACRVAGIALHESGKPAEAESWWDRARSIDPHHVETLQTMGMVRLQAGRRKEARDLFRQVLKLEPGNNAARYHVAQTYCRLVTDAGPGASSPTSILFKPDEEYEQVLSALSGMADDPLFLARHPDVLYMEGVARAELGQVAQAEALLKRFIARVPHSAVGPRTLGGLYYAHNRMQEGSSYLFSSYVLARPAAQRLYQQARNNLTSGQENAALSALAAGLELWPGNPEAYSMLERLAEKYQRAADVLKDVQPMRRIYLTEGS